MNNVLLISSGDIEIGGVQNFLYQWIQESNQEYRYIWYCCGKVLDKNLYDEILNLGVKVISSDIKKFGEKKLYYYFAQIKKIIKDYQIDIVHINTGVLIWNFLGVLASKQSHVNTIIAHSHSAIQQKGKMRNALANILKTYIYKHATICASCSKEAAVSVFGEKCVEKNGWKFVKNRIHVDKYRFNPEIREKMRRMYGITNEIVLGNVGQLYAVKNQKFLLEIMKIMKERGIPSKLLIIGDGPLKEELMTTIGNYQLDDNVLLLGEKKNVFEYLQMMDFFLMSSFHEGFSIAAVEAQASGLDCVFNECFSNEIALTDHVSFLSIDQPEKWVDAIEKQYLKQNEEYRSFCEKRIKDAGFDVASLKQVIKEMYS